MDNATADSIGLDDGHGKTLLTEAARTLAAALLRDEIAYPDPARFDPPLCDPGASFVTYEHGNDLVGCIGSIEREFPLVMDVSRNALLAAFADPRTPGLRAVPLEETSMKISVLSEPRAIEASSFEELTAFLRPGVDGVIVEYRGQRATLLPAVWEKVDSTEEFLDLLWRKAAIPPRLFDSEFLVSRYVTSEFFAPDLSRLIADSTSQA